MEKLHCWSLYFGGVFVLILMFLNVSIYFLSWERIVQHPLLFFLESPPAWDLTKADEGITKKRKERTPN